MTAALRGLRIVIALPLALFALLCAVPLGLIMLASTIGWLLAMLALGIGIGGVLTLIFYAVLFEGFGVSERVAEIAAFAFGMVPGIGYGIGLWWKDTFGSVKPKRGKDTHGSARFADDRDTAEFGGVSGGLLIGRDWKTQKLLRYHGPAHLLTLAPTRAGKGVGTVIPNLLLAERPMLVIDPKGENIAATGTARARFGPVHALDPFGIGGYPSASLNPMDRLHPDSLDLGEDAATLADALVMDPPGQVNEAHWNEEAKALLGGLILFAALQEEPHRRTLGTVREYLTLPPEQFTALLKLMQDSPHAHGLVARAANRFLGKADREAASVLSNAQRHTHFLDSPRMVKALERSTFRFSDLRRELCSVFLILPPNRMDAYARWLRLMVAESLHDIARQAETAQGRSQSAVEGHTAALPPCLFLLDEFAALGRLEAVERAMGLMAGYGVQLWPILQDMSQLKSLYGERAHTFVANAGVLQVFGVNDSETANWLSRSMGKETITYETKSYKPQEPTQTNLSEHVTGRELMTPDEIMRLASHLQLLRAQGKPPIIAEKLRYYADPEFRPLLDEIAAVHARHRA